MELEREREKVREGEREKVRQGERERDGGKEIVTGGKIEKGGEKSVEK